MGGGATIPVQSLDDDPRLAPYANQPDAWLRAAHNPERVDDRPDSLTEGGRFIAEGAAVVKQLLRSRFGVESALVSSARHASHRELLADMPTGAPVFVAPPEIMDAIVGYKVHRGVLACGFRGAPLAMADALRPVVVVLHDLANHDNVGGIFRSVAALAGRHGAVLLTPRTCDPLYRKAIRVSMGQSLMTPFATIEAGPVGVWQLRDAGYLTIALTPAPGAVSIHDLSLEPGARVALLAGSEGPGLDERTIRASDIALQIPINSEVDSLNVTVASSIAVQRVVHALGIDPRGSGVD